MSDFEDILKRENKIIKELFISNGSQTQLSHVKEEFCNFIKNSQNNEKDLIKLSDFYSHFKPQQEKVSKGLADCIFSCFSRTK